MSTGFPPRPVWRLIWRMHRLVWNLSGGRLGKSVGKMRVLQLVTTGHRSGLERPVLLAYVPTPDGPGLAGTNVGAEGDPAWVQNLRAHPQARVREGREWREVRARFAEGSEYEAVWKQFAEADKTYAGYRERVDRPIPIVVLEGA